MSKQKKKLKTLRRLLAFHTHWADQSQAMIGEHVDRACRIARRGPRPGNDLDAEVAQAACMLVLHGSSAARIELYLEQLEGVAPE